jgi:predicted secreted protein
MVVSTENVIAAAKTCEVEVSADVVEVSRSTGGAVRHFVAGRTEWSMSVGCLMTTTATVAQLEAMVGTEQNVTFGVRGAAVGERLTGRAIVQRLRWTGTRGDLATYSATLQGTGALS